MALLPIVLLVLRSVRFGKQSFCALPTDHWLSKFYYLNVLYGEGINEQHMVLAAAFSLMAFSPRFPWVVIDVPKWGPSEKQKMRPTFKRGSGRSFLHGKCDELFETLKLFWGEDVCNRLYRWFETCCFSPEPRGHDFVLANIFQMGWNHQLVIVYIIFVDRKKHWKL